MEALPLFFPAGQKKKASLKIGNAFYFLIMSIELSIFNSQLSFFLE